MENRFHRQSGAGFALMHLFPYAALPLRCAQFIERIRRGGESVSNLNGDLASIKTTTPWVSFGKHSSDMVKLSDVRLRAYAAYDMRMHGVHTCSPCATLYVQDGQDAKEELVEEFSLEDLFDEKEL